MPNKLCYGNGIKTSACLFMIDALPAKQTKLFLFSPRQQLLTCNITMIGFWKVYISMFIVIRQLTQCGPVTPCGDINLGQHWLGNVLLPDGSKALPEPTLTKRQWGLLTFAWGQFHRKCPRYVSLIWYSQLLIKCYSHAFQSQWVKLILVRSVNYSGQNKSFRISTNTSATKGAKSSVALKLVMSR